MRKQHSNMSKMIDFCESAVKYSETSIKRTPLGPSQVCAYQRVSTQQRFVKIAQCLLTINIQRLLCTVIKLYVVQEAIQSSTSLPFITNFNLLPNAKTLTDYSTYFKDIIQFYYCQSGVRLIVVFNNRNHPNVFHFSVCVGLIRVSAKQQFVTKENVRR